MDDHNWEQEYKQMKSLEAFKIKLLDEGAKTLSQAWLLNEMWSDWNANKNNQEEQSSFLSKNAFDCNEDPWN